MQVIDRDTLTNKAETLYQHTPSGKIIPWSAVRVCTINNIKTIDAEPVRHAESTTFIDTDDVSKWKSRVMVCERNSHWGRLYYESDTKHGQWVPVDEEIPCDEWDCTACGERRTFAYPMDFDEMKELYKYCPNCGAKME